MQNIHSTTCNKKSSVATLSLLVLAVMLVYRGYIYHPQQTGSVIDSSTGEPITDVVIMQEGTRHGLIVAASRSYCLHVAAALSDQTGHYRIPSWYKYALRYASDSGYSYRTYAYTPGYELEKVIDNTIYMKPFTGSKLQRAKQLDRVLNVCWNGDKADKMNLALLYNAMLSEAKTISGNASTDPIDDTSISRLLNRASQDIKLQKDIAMNTYHAIRWAMNVKHSGK